MVEVHSYQRGMRRIRRGEGNIGGAVNRGGQDKSIVVVHMFAEQIDAPWRAGDVSGCVSEFFTIVLTVSLVNDVHRCL